MPYTLSAIQEHTFTEQDIDDLLITALEGGINYWCYKVEALGMEFPNPDNYLGITNALINGQKVRFYDAESDDVWDLTIGDLLVGIKRYCQESGTFLSNLMDMHDAESADYIIQYALFGELVFG